MITDTEPVAQSGIQLLAESNIAREHNQDFPRALAMADASLAACFTEKDYYGSAEALCSRSLTHRHMAKQSGEQEYLNLAHAETTEAARIAKDHGVSTAIPLQNLAKTQREMGMEDEARESFRLALGAQRSNPHHTQDRPGVLANFQELYATAQLLTNDGDQEDAYTRTSQALADLEASDEDAYNKAVWLAHGHARIARALKDRDREKAKTHYVKAKEIITTNEALKLSENILADLEDVFV